MTDHFERLGLPRRFFVDPAALEQAYLAHSRQVHPDYHGLGSAAERQASEESAAALNEAYVTLRDPFRRGEYLLALAGGPSAQAEKGQDPAFLMEMMEFRERIEAAEEPNESAAIEAELTAREVAALGQVATLLDQLTSLLPTDPVRPTLLSSIRRALNETKTVRSLLAGLRSV